MSLLRGHRKRLLVTALVVIGSLYLFYLQWYAAPRVEIDPAVVAQLRHARPEAQYLGEIFEGLALRTVDPFLYSDCKPGVRKTSPTPCTWVRVDRGAVTGSDSRQVKRARKALRPVGADTP